MKEDICAKEYEMLSSVESYINQDMKNRIVAKIEGQKKAFAKIAEEKENLKKNAASEPENLMDDNYFHKKPLNVNNL